MAIEQKITPFLWFDNNAEEAVNFYTSVFKNSSVDTIARYTEAGPGPKGSVMVIAYTLNGQKYTALNGGPHYKFTQAVSFVVNCENQEEVDDYWNKLVEGGEPIECGWLKDKFGFYWQIVPVRFFELIDTADEAKRNRIMNAMMKMVKFDIAGLEKAAEDK